MENIFQFQPTLNEELALSEKFEERNSEEEVEELTIKYDTYSRLASKEPSILSLALVSKHHSLWAEFIYNAARLLADLIDGNSLVQNISPIYVENKKCLELGAGAGLPSILAALNGASTVVVSDYGHDYDLSLIYPLDINLQSIILKAPREAKHSDKLTASEITLSNESNGSSDGSSRNRCSCWAVGYTWGYPIHHLIDPSKYYQSSEISLNVTSYHQYKKTKLLARLCDQEVKAIDLQYSDNEKFDLIFCADLLFNRSEHKKLLWTIQQCLKPSSGICYITFSHHDPDKALLDLNFFSLAASFEYGFTVEKLGSQSRPSYPFHEDDGKDDLRGQIHIYTLKLL